VIGLPIAMHLFFMTRTGGKRTILKFIYLAYVPLAIYSTILTGSRTALIAIVPFVFFMIGTQQIKFDQKLIIFTLLFVALMIFIPFIPQSMLSRLSTIGSSIGEGDLGGRLNLWRETISVFAQHPISGIGSGAIISNIGSAAHNTFLSIAAETGLIGFLLFVSILGIVVYQAVHLPKGLSGLWLTVFLTWVIGVSSLSWEFRKLTWIILSFVILQSNTSASLAVQDAKKLFSGIMGPSPERGNSMPETRAI
jgi:O-antigen ligase